MGLFKNWQPKTVAGKILKVSTIGLGSAAVVATGVGAVAGAIGGGGLLAGAIAGAKIAAKPVTSIVSSITKKPTTTVSSSSRLAQSAKDLISGKNAEQRQLVKDAKADALEAKQQQTTIDKLVKLGKTLDEAKRQVLGSDYEQDVKSDESEDFISNLRKKAKKEEKEEDKKTNYVMYAGLGLVGLLLLKSLK